MENQKQLNNLESLTSINISDNNVFSDTYSLTEGYSIHKCPKCGKPMKVDLSKVLASLPPKYEAICTECKHVEYIRGDEIVYSIDKTPQTLPYRPNYLQADLCNHIFDIKLVNGNYVTYCTKCGKIGHTQSSFQPNIATTPGTVPTYGLDVDNLNMPNKSGYYIPNQFTCTAMSEKEASKIKTF